MIVTRDQLRAARMLLRLNQDQLAALSKVGVATIRRFEGGQGISALHLDALQRAVEGAGAVLVEPSGKHGAGVALMVAAKLPKSTAARLAAPASAGEGKGPGRPRLTRPAEGLPVQDEP